ncbi:hypothetical protein HWV62_28304 [Athelia sp. TMB]|nr:hypothetical protein HWV62_28304 [Athelia sp. TMB]
MLPCPAATILEFLDFKFPSITPTKTSASTEFFSQLEPTVMDPKLLKGIPVPSEETVKGLAALCKTAVTDGAASLVCLHLSWEVSRRVPLWMIPYWMEAAEIQKVHRPLWVEASDTMRARQGTRRGKCKESTHHLIEEVYSGLLTLSWSGKTRGFSNQEPVSTLATYATRRWLSDAHEDQMLDLPRTDIRLDPSKPAIDIKGTHFLSKIQQAYVKKDTGEYKDGRAFEWLWETGIELGNEVHEQLGCLVNVGGDHWVAIIIDARTDEILYGDSLGGDPGEELKTALSWWTRRHTNREFKWGKLTITRQCDGFSCGLFSWNALAHRFYPSKYPLMLADQADDGRLQVLLKVIHCHQNWNFCATSQGYKFTFASTLLPLFKQPSNPSSQAVSIETSSPNLWPAAPKYTERAVLESDDDASDVEVDQEPSWATNSIFLPQSSVSEASKPAESYLTSPGSSDLKIKGYTPTVPPPLRTSSPDLQKHNVDQVHSASAPSSPGKKKLKTTAATTNTSNTREPIKKGGIMSFFSKCTKEEHDEEIRRYSEKIKIEGKEEMEKFEAQRQVVDARERESAHMCQEKSCKRKRDSEIAKGERSPGGTKRKICYDEPYPLVAAKLVERLEKLRAAGVPLTLPTFWGIVVATILNMAPEIFEKKRKDGSIF